MNRKERFNAYDIEYGRHSNIPECCIKFFIKEWQQIWPDRWKSKLYFKGYSHVGYVPCRKCQDEKKYAVVHLCVGKTCESFNDILRQKYFKDIYK